VYPYADVPKAGFFMRGPKSIKPFTFPSIYDKIKSGSLGSFRALVLLFIIGAREAAEDGQYITFIGE
jgi:hypothetical protein